jgi:hypothetical protein
MFSLFWTKIVYFNAKIDICSLLYNINQILSADAEKYRNSNFVTFLAHENIKKTAHSEVEYLIAKLKKLLLLPWLSKRSN